MAIIGLLFSLLVCEGNKDDNAIIEIENRTGEAIEVSIRRENGNDILELAI